MSYLSGPASERERLFSGRSNNDFMTQSNDAKIDVLDSKTEQLKNAVRSLGGILTEDASHLSSLGNVIDQSSTAVSGVRRSLKAIVDDPSAFGVMKIAILVFTILCVLYFGGKLLCYFLSK